MNMESSYIEGEALAEAYLGHWKLWFASVLGMGMGMGMGMSYARIGQDMV
jgi:hypothetical protein